MAFQELELLPKERIAKKFHECCLKEFNWDIATYTAMNSSIFNEVNDNEELDSMKEYIKTIIKAK
jgi:hypothetical protein